jgi:hypothetical protein
MNLLTPTVGAALLAATVVPLLALYFLRLRRARRTVGSVIGWVRRVEDLRANAPFQRLRPSWLLLLQLLLLALLGLAVAQPVLRGLGGGGGRVALLIDCSASMRTVDCDGRSRLEEAIGLAVDRAEALQGGGLFALTAPELMVISFAGSAEVLVPMGRSLSAVREAIESIRPTDERTLLQPALELARAHRAGAAGDDATASEPIRIEIFSDGRFADAADVAPRASESFEWTRVGRTDTVNAGLSAAGVERSVEDPARVEAFAALRNFGPVPVVREVTVRSDGMPLAVTPAGLEVPALSRDDSGPRPGERRLAFAPFASSGQRLVEMSCEPGDAFAVDDGASVALREARAPSVALVGADASVEALLAALPLKSLARLDVAAAEAAIARDVAWAEAFDAVVCVGRAPRDVSRGRWLVFGPPPELPGLHPFGEPVRDYARTSRGDHPALRQCNLNELVVRKAHAFSAERPWVALIEGGRAPLAVAGATPRGFAIVVGFEPADSNWPFQRSFVNFTAQAIELLAGLADLASEESVAPGDMIRTRVPDGVRDLAITPPGGRPVPLSVRDGEASWGPARRTGAYRVDWKGADGASQVRWVAVNQLDPQECDVASAESLSLGGAAIADSGARVGLVDAWPWLLGIALALLLLEWWMYHRQASR